MKITKPVAALLIVLALASAAGAQSLSLLGERSAAAVPAGVPVSPGSTPAAPAVRPHASHHVATLWRLYIQELRRYLEAAPGSPEQARAAASAQDLVTVLAGRAQRLETVYASRAAAQDAANGYALAAASGDRVSRAIANAQLTRARMEAQLFAQHGMP